MRTILSIAFVLFGTAYTSAQPKSESIDKPTSEVVLTSEVQWGALNAARGDQSPRAGNLWGDRTSSEPSGFLVKFKEGFSSPPHIHNITYRGVVITGLLHNDDPDAEEMWMPTGSFWTQPAGEGHITAAKGEENMALVEIEEGPYLVQPADEAFDNGERPVNLDKSNIVWVDVASIEWINLPRDTSAADGPKAAFLWGNPQSDQLSGTLLKLPAGFSGKIHSNSSNFRAVLIQGKLQHQEVGETETKNLMPGSYFGSTGEMVHKSQPFRKIKVLFI